MLIWLTIIIAVMMGTYLLALVSDAFAYELSRGVEALLDFAECELVERAQLKAKRLARKNIAY
jgi:hypothetical protein